jgi:hypothetical protein
MTTLELSLLLVVSLAAPAPSARRLPDPGAGGLILDLPSGFVRGTGPADGQPVRFAVGPGGEAVAVVQASAPVALECGRADASAAGLTPFKTRGGIDGCLAVRREPDGAVAVIQLSSTDGSASVAVLAPDEPAARRLALQVAGTARPALPVTSSAPR